MRTYPIHTEDNYAAMVDRSLVTNWVITFLTVDGTPTFLLPNGRKPEIVNGTYTAAEIEAEWLVESSSLRDRIRPSM